MYVRVCMCVCGYVFFQDYPLLVGFKSKPKGKPPTGQKRDTPIWESLKVDQTKHLGMAWACPSFHPKNGPERMARNKNMFGDRRNQGYHLYGPKGSKDERWSFFLRIPFFWGGFKGN